MNNLGFLFADWRGRANVMNDDLDGAMTELNKIVDAFINEAYSDTGGIQSFQAQINSIFTELSLLFAKTHNKAITEYLKTLNDKLLAYDQKIANMIFELKYPLTTGRPYVTAWRKLYLKGGTVLSDTALSGSVQDATLSAFGVDDALMLAYQYLPNFNSFVNKITDQLSQGVAELVDRSLKEYITTTKTRARKVQVYANSIVPTINAYTAAYTAVTDDIMTSAASFMATLPVDIPKAQLEPVPLPQETVIEPAQPGRDESEWSRVTRPTKQEYLSTPSGSPYKVRSEPTITTIKTKRGIEVVSTYEREPMVLNHAELGLVYIR